MKSFRDLRVWQKAMELVERVYVLDSEVSERGDLWFVESDSASSSINPIEYRGRAHEGAHQRVPSPHLNGPSVVS